MTTTPKAMDLAVQWGGDAPDGRVLLAAATADDVLSVIKAAAGCETTLSQGEATYGRPREALREAAAQYLIDAHFFADAQPERILGVSGLAERSLILTHRRWLLKWLHPDANSQFSDPILMNRVLTASQDLLSASAVEADLLNITLAPLRGPSALHDDQAAGAIVLDPQPSRSETPPDAAEDAADPPPPGRSSVLIATLALIACCVLFLAALDVSEPAAMIGAAQTGLDSDASAVVNVLLKKP